MPKTYHASSFSSISSSKKASRHRSIATFPLLALGTGSCNIEKTLYVVDVCYYLSKKKRSKISLHTLWQVKHSSRFRNWPWKKSTIKLSFRDRQLRHSRSLAICVGNRSSSASSWGVGEYEGFTMMRFRSSCMPSIKKLRNSCESCWSDPLYWDFNRQIDRYTEKEMMNDAKQEEQMVIYTLKSIGVRYGRSPPHISWRSLAKAPVSLPFEPSGFV